MSEADVLLPVRDALAAYLSPAHLPSDSTLARWRRGLGSRKLDCTRVGSRWFCRPSDVERFLSTNNGPGTPTVGAARRQRIVDSTLDKEGF